MLNLSGNGGAHWDEANSERRAVRCADIAGKSDNVVRILKDALLKQKTSIDRPKQMGQSLPIPS